jgi:hypothetical protein
MSPIYVIRAAVLVLALSSLQGQSQAQQPRQPPTKAEVQSQPASRSDPVPENKSAVPGTLPQAGGKKRFLEDWLPSNPDEVRKSLLTALLTLATALIVFFSKQLGHGARRIGTFLWTRLRVQRASETHYRRSIAKELRSIQLFRMMFTNSRIHGHVA